MKLLLLLLFTTASFADDYIHHVQVRVVTFEKAGAATALEAAQPNCDESLYASLTADTATGKAARVQDQTMVVRNGHRSKVVALRQFPFPTESTANAAEWFLYPSYFTWKNVGQTLEAEATVGEREAGWPQHPLDINFAPDCQALVALHPWPVPDFRGSGQMGRTLQPVFAGHRLSTQALAWTGRTLLVSVSPAPDAAFSTADELSFRYTFLRAGLDGEKPAPSAGSPPAVMEQSRLHAITIRLLRMEASALLLQQAGDDAALYGTLRGMVAEGRATVSDHSAILCRGGQSAMMTSEAEFQYPEHNDDLIPTGWAILGSGSRLDAEAQFDRWNVALVRHEAPELVRLLRRGTAHAVALASHERSSGASRRSGICVIRGHFLPYGARLSNMSRIWPRSSSSMAR